MIKISLIIGSADMPESYLVHLFRDEIEENIARTSSLGYDGVELIIGDPDSFDSDRLEKALSNNKMELACINSYRIVSELGLTLIHSDKNKRAEAFKKLQDIVKIAGRFKCYFDIGLFRGKAIEAKPISYTRDMFIEIMQEACDFAKKYSVGLNLEPTNRFELNFINSTNEGIEIIEKVNRPNLGILLDLYHMYIEDRDMVESIKKSKDYVKHFHFADSNRWPPGVGSGVIDFGIILKTLKEINFNGFLSECLAPIENVDEYARKTACFLKELIEK